MTDWLLANPKAGDGERDAGFWQTHLVQAGVTETRLCDLDDQGWVENLGPEDRILAAGGDGSVNRAASLCLQTGAALAVLPSGTANDFFRNLGIEDDPESICRAVADGVTHRVDLAEYDRGIYLNVAHIGLGTMPSRDANANGGSKKWLGRFSYGLSLFRRVLTKRGFRATVHTDQAMLSGRWLSLAVANGGYFGGGNEVPGANIASGELVIIAIRPASLPGLASAFILTRILGRTPKENKTVMEVRSPWCRITTGYTKTVTVDGDVASQTPFNATCGAGKLRVIAAEVSSPNKPRDASS